MTSRAEISNYAGGDEKFTNFLVKVDAAVEARVGMGIFDLADYAWRDAFDDHGENIDEESLKELVTDFIQECS